MQIYKYTSSETLWMHMLKAVAMPPFKTVEYWLKKMKRHVNINTGKAEL